MLVTGSRRPCRLLVGPFALIFFFFALAPVALQRLFLEVGVVLLYEVGLSVVSRHVLFLESLEHVLSGFFTFEHYDLIDVKARFATKLGNIEIFPNWMDVGGAHCREDGSVECDAHRKRL